MILDWFKTKKRLMKENAKFARLAVTSIETAKRRLEELDPSKIYLLVMMGATEKEIRELDELVTVVREGVKWTMPAIVITNGTVSNLTSKELKELAKKQKEVEK